MKFQKIKVLAIATLNLCIATGCSSEAEKVEMKTVNEENCRPESIANIKQKETRDQFQERCVRSAQFKVSPEKKW